MNRLKKIRRWKAGLFICFLSLFFCWSAFSNSFASSQTEEPEKKYNLSHHAPFPISKVEETYKTYSVKRDKMDFYLLFQKIVWELSSEDVFVILNFNNTRSPIHKEELDVFYRDVRGTLDSKKFIDFIKKHKLSSQESVIFLMPVIREGGLSSSEIFDIIREIKLSPNTKIHYENLIPLFDTYKMPFYDLQQKLLTDSSYEASYKERRLFRLFYAYDSKMRYLREKNFGKRFRVGTKEVISSLAHIIMATRDPLLIEKLYNMKRFNPNAVDVLNQTPLHSLFLLDRGDLKLGNHLSLLVKQKDSTDFSPIETLSLGGMALKLKELDGSSKNGSDALLYMDTHPTVADKTFSQDWEYIFSAIQRNPKTNFNVQDLMGMTPLAVATRWDFFSAVKELIEIESVDLSVKDRYNRSLAILSAFPGSPGPESPSQSLRQKEITNLIIERGGGRKQQVILSFFNNYLDQNLDLVEVRPLHPLKKILISVAQSLSSGKSSAIENYDELFELYQKLIPLIINFRDDPKHNSVFSAIEKDDVQFFIDNKKKDAEIMHILNTDITITIQNEGEVGEEEYIVYNPLLHAIISNSPKVVEFMLKNLKKDHFFTPSVSNFAKTREARGEKLNNPISLLHMDPLSEAFLVSNQFYLENRGKSVAFALKKNRRIINMLLKHKKTDPEYVNYVNLSTIEMAVLTGNLFAVKYLYEKLEIPLPDFIWDTSVEFHEVAKKHGFLKMEQYILEKTEPYSWKKSCKTVFH